MHQILLNIGYGLMFTALAVRDILWLRLLLVAAQLSLFSYAIFIDNHNVAFWNLLFLGINSFQVLRLLRERRPIEIPETVKDIYEKLFSSMTTREFLYFWHMGSEKIADNEVLIKQGEQVENLLLVLDGSVEIVRDGKKIAQLGRGFFVAEMSFLSGETASADVRASQSLKYLCWKQEKIRSLKQLHPGLMIKIQNILGKDLAHKIRKTSPK